MPKVFVRRHGLAPPQGPDGVDLFVHDFPTRLVALGKEDEIVDVPARAEGDRDATGGELVDQGPFLSNADGVMQRRDEASGAQLQAVRDHGEGGREDGRVGEKSTERAEVPFGCPNAGEAMAIGEPGDLQQQVVGCLDVAIGREEHDAEFHQDALILRFASRLPRLSISIRDDTLVEQREIMSHYDITSKATATTAREPVTSALSPLFHPRIQRWQDHFRWIELDCGYLGIEPS